MNVILRYFHTLRYLKLKQIIFQIKKRLFRRTFHRINAPVTKRSSPVSINKVEWIKKSASLTHDLDFSCLGEVRKIPAYCPNWHLDGVSMLWTYNMHYFDFLLSSQPIGDANFYEKLICQWIDNNCEINKVGWDPYPTSLRIVNWIKWLTNNPAIKNPKIESSLFDQVQFLHSNIEYHILGNHLFSNIKALIFGLIFFQSAITDSWMKRIFVLLKRELDEQIKIDGFHFELSPMYHSIILEDILDLINLSERYNGTIPSELVSRLKLNSVKMTKALMFCTHPDGEIPYFNDAVIGVSTQPLTLLKYKKKLVGSLYDEKFPTNEIKYFESAKFLAYRKGECFAILDLGEVGAKYISGHAHADTLSFELSLFKERVIVNTGISTYEKNTRRHYERSTSSHSTVNLNGISSSDTWGGFRTGRRAYPLPPKISKNTDSFSVFCGHDGYDFLKKNFVHYREWKFNDKSLKITDSFSAVVNYNIFANYIIGPNFKITHVAEEYCVIEFKDIQIKIEITGGKFILENADYSVGFGVLKPTKKLVIKLTGEKIEVLFKW